MILGSNQYYERLSIDAANVYDITPLQNMSFPTPTPPVTSPPVPTIPQAKRPQPAFQDPAILSLTPRSDSTSHFAHPPTQPNIAEKRDPPFVTNPADRMTYDSPDEITDAAASANITAPMAQLKISPNPETIHVPRETVDSVSAIPFDPSDPRKDRSRGTRGRGRRRNKIAEGNGSSAQRNNRGPGWRETPILESTESFQPFKALKKNQKARVDALANNGWASEDVTDVQGAGDFDFEGGLAKFDKRKIFDEMKQQDKIDEAERLVSHNRLPRPKPGTAGGKNLHYTENVLDMPATTLKPKESSGDYWKSEADDEVLNGAEHSGSGRNSRLRGESRMSMNRRSQSRKASTAASVGGPSRVNSGVRKKTYKLLVV